MLVPQAVCLGRSIRYARALGQHLECINAFFALDTKITNKFSNRFDFVFENILFLIVTAAE